MSTAAQEKAPSPSTVVQEVSQFSDAELDDFWSRITRLRAERRAPHLSMPETDLLEIINYRLPPEAQARFDFLLKRMRSNRITRKEHAELLTMTDASEQFAADRIQAVLDLATLRGLTFDEMWKQLGL